MIQLLLPSCLGQQDVRIHGRSTSPARLFILSLPSKVEGVLIADGTSDYLSLLGIHDVIFCSEAAPIRWPAFSREEQRPSFFTTSLCVKLRASNVDGDIKLVDLLFLCAHSVVLEDQPQAPCLAQADLTPRQKLHCNSDVTFNERIEPKYGWI